MSKLKDAILASGKAYAGHSPVLNLAYGGQNGHMNAIGRAGPDGSGNFSEWISNQAYVKQNIIPVVMDYPKAFDLMADSQMWIDTYNAIMTLHPLTITGLTSGLTVEFAEHAVGGAGEMQEEITKVSRARSTLNKTYKEKSGKSIQKFIDMVIRYLYSDPDMEKPLLFSGAAGITNPVEVAKLGAGMYTPEYFTGTNLYIEPDITQQQVVDAWMVTNIMFKGNGERTGKRDTHSARETMDLAIDFTGITMNNESVLRLADTVLKGLNVLNASPDNVVLPVINPSASLAATNNKAVSFDTTPGAGATTSSGVVA